MGQEIIIKIEGLEELTKAMLTMAGAVMDHQAFMEKGGLSILAPAGIEASITKPVADLDKVIKEVEQKIENEYELATKDMYYANKAKNSVIKIAKGQPLEVPEGYKATTKAKYDEFYGEDGADAPVSTPGDQDEYEPEDDNDADPTDPEDEVTMEDVRAKFVALDKATEKGAAKKILAALKVDKLMDMDPSDYPKALKMAEDALKKAGK